MEGGHEKSIMIELEVVGMGFEALYVVSLFRIVEIIKSGDES